MEKLQSHKIPFITLRIILAVQFSSVLLPSSAYELPEVYFLNCGSESSTDFNTRTFVGDGSFSVIPGKTVQGSSPSAGTELYQTARVFDGQTSSYEFQIKETGMYFVRLHFFAFSSPSASLAGAVFGVWAQGFQLLSNFSIPSTSTSPKIEEFLLTVEQGEFILYFIPSNGSLAFVNAIEVFLAPPAPGFIPDNTFRVSSAGSNGNYSELLSHALHQVYRLDVGGSILTAYNDTLLRNWMPDDGFLTFREAAKNSSFFIGPLNWPDIYIAPDLVYKTAKELKSESNFSNIAWGFIVGKKAKYFVRAHFCNIVNELSVFNLNIYSNFSQNISLITGGFPRYFDFVVDSDNSGYLNISVAPDSPSQNAILNGLEIMEMMDKSGSKPNLHGNSKKSSIAGPIFGGGAFLLIAMVALWMLMKYRAARPDRASASPFSVPLFGRISSNRMANLSLPADLKLALKLTYTELQRATNNFNSKFLIGEGGFGKVYKGTLRDGAQVAVKRREPGYGQGLMEFQTEIMVLSQIRHRHLVSLIGYCDDGSEMILVYEYMEKGTLREHLYASEGNSESERPSSQSEGNSESEKPSSQSKLSWVQRLEICIDAAKGLQYLHTGLLRPIIHRDVKSTNILLGENYIAKVADFGLSKSGLPDADQDNTGVKGSFGYLDPEYFMSQKLTEKSDVYSFGVVLLEVLCARPVIITSNRREEENLADWGKHWQKKGQLEKIIDPFLQGKVDPNSLRIFGETAEKCLKPKSDERPDMEEVLWYLEFALKQQLTASKREPHEDSMTDASSQFALRTVHHLPSHYFPVDYDFSLGADGGSSRATTDVFSQLTLSGAR